MESATHLHARGVLSCSLLMNTKALLEASPGSGWLARESELIIWIQDPLDFDAAYSCIEPTLMAGSFDAAMSHLRAWPTVATPFAVLGLTSPMQLAMRGFSSAYAAGKVTLTPARRDDGSTVTVYSLPPATSSVGLAKSSSDCSGMLVEGVVRAGAFNLHRQVNRSIPQPPLTGTKWELVGQSDRWPINTELVIGRALAQSNFGHGFVSLPDPAVSRTHAVLQRVEEGAAIIDSVSRNGTYVARGDGEFRRVRSDSPMPLDHGDKIIVGQSLLSVRITNHEHLS